MSGAVDTRAFVLGAVFDFVMWCVRTDPAFIIGVGYPRDKFIAVFEAWAKERGLALERIDLEKFRQACELKMLG